MLEGKTNPLDIAKRVLKPETLKLVMGSQFHSRAWQILDRWAMNTPALLKELEGKGEIPFLSRLLEQQQIEQEILMTDEALQAKHQGQVDFEILQANHVQTELQ